MLRRCTQREESGASRRSLRKKAKSSDVRYGRLGSANMYLKKKELRKKTSHICCKREKESEVVAWREKECQIRNLFIGGKDVAVGRRAGRSLTSGPRNHDSC